MYDWDFCKVTETRDVWDDLSGFTQRALAASANGVGRDARGICLYLCCRCGVNIVLLIRSHQIHVRSPDCVHVSANASTSTPFARHHSHHLRLAPLLSGRASLFRAHALSLDLRSILPASAVALLLFCTQKPRLSVASHFVSCSRLESLRASRQSPMPRRSFGIGCL